ncbi:MAG: DUF5989 family protein [Verrucomicrobiia bacterium]|jgi:hypothetical protein
MSEKQDKDFEKIEPEELSLFAEFIQMLKHNKKYWMIPIVLMLLGFGILLILGSTGAAPFIYTLF